MQGGVVVGWVKLAFDDESGDFGGRCDGKAERRKPERLPEVMKKCSPVRGIRNCDETKGFVAPLTVFDSGVLVAQGMGSDVEASIALDDVLWNLKYGSSVTAVLSRGGWAGEKLPKVVPCK